MDRSTTGTARCIQLARLGRSEALDALLETYRNYLHFLASSCLRNQLRSKADPSDVVQETLLKVHANFDRFRGTTEQEWMGWLRRILVRSLADLERGFLRHRRDLARERSLESDLERSAAALRNLLPAADQSPSQEAQHREIGALVADALAGLEAEHREVIIMRNFNELDWREIGVRIDRSPDAARMLWVRALQQVARLLQDRTA